MTANGRRRSRVVATMLILTTWPFLMGHGCEENRQEVCEIAVDLIKAYQVSGNCGPAGQIQLTSRARSCSLSVTGGKVGLPTQGSRINSPGTDISLGGWRLDGELNGVFTRCLATAKGTSQHVTCNTDNVAVICTAVLTPVM
jgi:hypothetical protein